MTWPGAGIGLESKYHGPPALPIPWVLHLSLRFPALFFSPPGTPGCHRLLALLSPAQVHLPKASLSSYDPGTFERLLDIKS